MTMRRVFFTLAFTAILFAGCSKDDDSTTEQPVVPPTEEAVPDQVRMSFTYDATPDMLRFLDIVVTYNDGTGEQQDTITTAQWTKTLSGKLPATFSFTHQARVKEDMYDTMVATGTVYITRHFSYTYDILDSAGNVIPGMSVSYNSPGSRSMAGVGSAAAEGYNQGNLDKTHTYYFNAQGEMTTSAE